MIMICGLPASGKSSAAACFGRNVLEYDFFAERTGSYEDLIEERELVDRQFVLLAQSGLYDVVVDVFYTVESRRSILDVCTNVSLIIVDTPLDICLKRNSARRSWLSNEELARIACMFEPVSPSEGFSSVKILKGW